MLNLNPGCCGQRQITSVENKNQAGTSIDLASAHAKTCYHLLIPPDPNTDHYLPAAITITLLSASGQLTSKNQTGTMPSTHAKTCYHLLIPADPNTDHYLPAAITITLFSASSQLTSRNQTGTMPSAHAKTCYHLLIPADPNTDYYLPAAAIIIALCLAAQVEEHSATLHITETRPAAHNNRNQAATSTDLPTLFTASGQLTSRNQACQCYTYTQNPTSPRSPLLLLFFTAEYPLFSLLMPDVMLQGTDNTNLAANSTDLSSNHVRARTSFPTTRVALYLNDHSCYISGLLHMATWMRKAENKQANTPNSYCIGGKCHCLILASKLTNTSTLWQNPNSSRPPILVLFSATANPLFLLLVPTVIIQVTANTTTNWLEASSTMPNQNPDFSGRMQATPVDSRNQTGNLADLPTKTLFATPVARRLTHGKTHIAVAEAHRCCIPASAQCLHQTQASLCCLLQIVLQDQLIFLVLQEMDCLLLPAHRRIYNNPASQRTNCIDRTQHYRTAEPSVVSVVSFLYMYRLCSKCYSCCIQNPFFGETAKTVRLLIVLFLYIFGDTSPSKENSSYHSSLFCDTAYVAKQIPLGESCKGISLTLYCNTAACCCR